ncbi:bifunctional (p)ppGpp synthetase/guanosine-3',5'-bis(diphosphate) 3'-pyrophosphohydrolase [Candidatus Woesearchaeota archaeon]|nr:bifunctional (p)ppGpp synthetase/guanosine-3',5'-bis(diphosphate) 3'-pyrophosphohydrolase [Candidatus Woesearchaeota archaeon]
MDFASLRQTVLKYNPNANLALIERAFEFAKEAHAGQVRDSGEEYMSHLYGVAMTLAELHMDSVTLAAGLLHDCLEDTPIKPERLRDVFGDEVFELVQGVTKSASINFGDKEEKRAINIRNVLLATAKDIRVIIIKLADRLHNMRTLKFVSPDCQSTIAKETLDIYAPIAYKLGMHKIKAELEDLAFRYLEPQMYQEFKQRMGKKRDERQKEVDKFMMLLDTELKRLKIPARIFGRAKHFYSIYKKMQRKNLRFEEVTDLSAVRVITTSVENCYRILQFVHTRWKPIDGKLDDYIADPKPNLYQSLHTEVWSDDHTPVEVQIRTLEMHHIAEEGIAAHWRYKGTERDKRFESKINWLKQILTWKRESKDAKGFIESLKVDLFQDEIIVFTPKGDAISLREDATPIDFAYAVHSSIGDHCVRGKVNGRVMPLDTTLHSGDVVEIMTKPDARPSRQWLKVVKTSLARNKIRHALGIPVHDQQDARQEDVPSEAAILSKVSVQALKKQDLRYARCCSPAMYDSIAGFEQKDGKVAIHKRDCKNLSLLEHNKCVVASWDEEKREGIQADIDVYVKDRVGVLVELLNHVSSRRINVLSIHTKQVKDLVKISLTFDVPSEAIGLELMKVLGTVHSVHHVAWERRPSRQKSFIVPRLRLGT